MLPFGLVVVLVADNACQHRFAVEHHLAALARQIRHGGLYRVHPQLKLEAVGRNQKIAVDVVGQPVAVLLPVNADGHRVAV